MNQAQAQALAEALGIIQSQVGELTVGRLRVLMQVASRPGLSQRELSEVLGMHKERGQSALCWIWVVSGGKA